MQILIYQILILTVSKDAKPEAADTKSSKTTSLNKTQKAKLEVQASAPRAVAGSEEKRETIPIIVLSTAFQESFAACPEIAELEMNSLGLRRGHGLGHEWLSGTNQPIHEQYLLKWYEQVLPAFHLSLGKPPRATLKAATPQMMSVQAKAPPQTAPKATASVAANAPTPCPPSELNSNQMAQHVAQTVVAPQQAEALDAQTAAAIRIQSLQRGRADRERVALLKAQRDEAEG
jgi:hypothetical protein